MEDSSLTKVFDGLFMGYCDVAEDLAFIVGNKIDRILCLYKSANTFSADEAGIKIFKTGNINSCHTPFEEIDSAIQFLLAALEDYLCTLILSQTPAEAAALVVAYLMRRFNWTLASALPFVTSKLSNFHNLELFQDRLVQYEHHIMVKGQVLKEIRWEYEWLQGYHTEDNEQRLVITTCKNTLIPTMSYPLLLPNRLGTKKNKPVKSKRVKWQDQLKPSSAFSCNKYYLRPSSSHKTISKAPSTRPCTRPGQENVAWSYETGTLGGNMSSMKQTPRSKVYRMTPCEEDLQYLQLKDLSRTNFNSRNFPVKQGKKIATKRAKPDFSLSAIVSQWAPPSQWACGGFGARNPDNKKVTSKSASSLDFLNGLKRMAALQNA